MWEDWISKRKSLRNVDNLQGVYVNELLSSYFSELFWKAKMRCKEKQYKYVWVKYGRILVKKDPNSHTMRINDEKDLNKIN
jgi:hypothetical protein